MFSINNDLSLSSTGEECKVLSDEILLDKSKTIFLCYHEGGKSKQKVCFHLLKLPKQ